LAGDIFALQAIFRRATGPFKLPGIQTAHANCRLNISGMNTVLRRIALGLHDLALLRLRFDQHYYFERHPEAQEAVLRGEYRDGIDHYRRAGRAKGYIYHDYYKLRYPVNDVPVAVTDRIILLPSGEATELTSGNSSVLDNGIDADDDSLEAVLVDGPSHGVLDLSPDGTLALTACATLKPPTLFIEKISVDRIAITGAGLNVGFRLRNPNPEPMLIERFEYELAVNGQNLGRGFQPYDVKIEAFEDREVVSRFDLNLLKLPGVVKSVRLFSHRIVEEFIAILDGYVANRYGRAEAMVGSGSAERE
jgi:hypothetical protein